MKSSLTSSSLNKQSTLRQSSKLRGYHILKLVHTMGQDYKGGQCRSCQCSEQHAGQNIHASDRRFSCTILDTLTIEISPGTQSTRSYACNPPSCDVSNYRCFLVWLRQCLNVQGHWTIFNARHQITLANRQCVISR